MKGSNFFIKKTSYLKFYLFILLLALFCSVHAGQDNLTQQIQQTLDRAIAKSSVTPGAVLLVSSPKIGTIIVASGFADKAARTPMQITNNFRLASISKTFVAVVVLKMSEDNVFKLNDKISSLLPNTIDINRLPNGTQITVKQLLGMRSGIPNYVDYDAYEEKVEAEPNLLWTPKDAIEIIYDEEPNFAPDKSYEYSNTNYLILQSIIEQTTHTALATQLRKFIFTPLQLGNTYLELHEEQPGGFHGLRTHGYELQKNGQLKDVTTLNDGLGLADGGIVSTAHDLAKFVQALLQTKSLLPENLLKEMLIFKGPDQYGLGIYREEVGGEMPWTHNGTSSGFCTQYYYFPTRQLTLIILTNSLDTDIIDTVAAKVLKIIKLQDTQH